ncbi:MAG: transporter [Isosphaeraceae bacterium]
MANGPVLGVACVVVVVVGTSARAQTPESRAAEGSANADSSQTTSPHRDAEEADTSQPDETESAAKRSLIDRLCAALSQDEDPDGPINTDRPTFTPANTVVPRGRLQFESGFTFNSERSATARSNLYDLPELAMRLGLADRVEFRTFWLGQTWIQTQPRRGGPYQESGGLSDMEVGFKWQLFAGDKERKWIPTTALITSIYAPTGGTSTLGAHTVEPYINLVYGWALTDKLTLAGSTGYVGMRQTDLGRGRPADSFERYHQSLVAFLAATERTTLFYEWYAFMFTNAASNLPMYFMDGGLLYHPTPNTQIDLRAGFGLTGRPDDFFTGAGLSVRF